MPLRAQHLSSLACSSIVHVAYVVHLYTGRGSDLQREQTWIPWCQAMQRNPGTFLQSQNLINGGSSSIFIFDGNAGRRRLIPARHMRLDKQFCSVTICGHFSCSNFRCFLLQLSWLDIRTVGSPSPSLASCSLTNRPALVEKHYKVHTMTHDGSLLLGFTRNSATLD